MNFCKNSKMQKECSQLKAAASEGGGAKLCRLAFHRFPFSPIIYCQQLLVLHAKLTGKPEEPHAKGSILTYFGYL